MAEESAELSRALKLLRLAVKYSTAIDCALRDAAHDVAAASAQGHASQARLFTGSLQPGLVVQRDAAGMLHLVPPSIPLETTMPCEVPARAEGMRRRGRAAQSALAGSTSAAPAGRGEAAVPARDPQNSHPLGLEHLVGRDCPAGMRLAAGRGRIALKLAVRLANLRGVTCPRQLDMGSVPRLPGERLELAAPVCDVEALPEPGHVKDVTVRLEGAG